MFKLAMKLFILLSGLNIAVTIKFINQIYQSWAASKGSTKRPEKRLKGSGQAQELNHGTPLTHRVSRCLLSCKQ